MSLLREIQEAAIDSSVSLPTLLRKCKVLASRLGNAPFKEWIDHELSGYPSKGSLPGYRILEVNSKGHFSGAFGSGLRNADIPMLCIPEEFRENLQHAYLHMAVAAMASLVEKNRSATVAEPWSPDLVAHVGRGIYQDMNCIQAWKVIPAIGLVAALDEARTRVLNFVLEIESANPAAGDAPLNSNPVPQDRVQHIFNTYITGNVQNLASGSTDFEQAANYSEGIGDKLFLDLLASIREATAPAQVKQRLAASVEGMKVTKGTSGFKAHYIAFMSGLADHMQVLGPVVAPFLPALSSLGS
ncbi:MAG: hypothetical protein WB784_04400 [Rhodanobacteraceae bacterium]